MTNAPQTITIRDDFDLNKIADSGQCFRVRKFSDGLFRFVTKDKVLYIKEVTPRHFSISCGHSEWMDVWNPYFDLSRNYSLIRQAIQPSDKYMVTAANEGAGIRILRQDPWETLVTFIISQRKSIPAIKQSIELLSEQFGTSVETEYEHLFLFPTITQIQAATYDNLSACKLGYRTSYIESAISLVGKNIIDLNAIDCYSDLSLFQTLKTIKGVGDKVSNCVCLFAYGRTSLSPIDTWILKIINEKYGGNNPFPAYGENAGIMQQYAFYYALNHKRG
jgi:N-glycosylase/DNA lyase